MPARVLVVEDTPENLELMTYLLRAFGHEPLAAMDGAAGVALASQSNPDIIVMDLQMPVMTGFEAASALRSDATTQAIPLVAVTAYAMVGDRDKILAAGFDGYIAKPIDPETFVQQVEFYLAGSGRGPGAGSGGQTAEEVDRPGHTGAAAPDPDTGEGEGLAGRARRMLAERLSVVQSAALAAEEGTLSADSRRAAEREAHRIAGAAASFGYPAATEPARSIELMLAGAQPLRPVPLSMTVRTLRAAMSTQTIDRTTAPRPAAALHVCVVGDAEVARALADTVGERKVDVLHVASAVDLLADGPAANADVVVLDVAGAGPPEQWQAALDELARQVPAPPVLALTDTGSDRVTLAARGAHGYHHRSLAPEALLEECLRLAGAHLGGSTVLAIDDDELALASIAHHLEPAGLRVVTSQDTADVPALLDEIRPDLLVLNLDMPGIDGVQLCRSLRASVQWATLPVLFLTARRDSDSIERIFRSGADDYVAKPVVGAELQVRIRNRLDRVRLYRELANCDQLTGLSTRRHCHDGMRSLLALAKRFDQPLCVTLVDIDHFKDLNDRFGHGMGDDALRCLGLAFNDGLRGEDVTGRWGGEEFLAAMFGMSADDAVRRVEALHEGYRQRVGRLSPQVTSSFSAGIACFPQDGHDLDRLLSIADRRLYAAKAQGRARIVSQDEPVPVLG